MWGNPDLEGVMGGIVVWGVDVLGEFDEKKRKTRGDIEITWTLRRCSNASELSNGSMS
jgi:hypothetical protein